MAIVGVRTQPLHCYKILLLLFCLTTLSFVQANYSPSGVKCIGCVASLTIADLALEKYTVELLLDQCALLPKLFSQICTEIVQLEGDKIVEYLKNKLSPDYICTELKACSNCHLEPNYPKYLITPEDVARHDRQVQARAMAAVLQYQLMTLVQNREVPSVDFDDDEFSSFHDTHRGADWRGKDCDDVDDDIHPGIHEPAGSIFDRNCNGVYGYDFSKRQSYEDMYCNGTDERSFAVFGDSASAGFSIPVQFVTLQNLTDLAHCLSDEFDWPNLAWGSAWDDGIGDRSIYRRLRQNNRCNHRDYQNLAKNGAEIKDLAGYQVDSLNVADSNKPFLATVAFIGNDVCRYNLSEMTTPEDFRASLLLGLNKLDKKLPKGSSLLLLGLVDGRILWNTMHNLTHPLGVTYADFYEFLTCNECNPCGTWLNKDEATRNATSERAQELSSVMLDVVDQSKSGALKFNNIKLGFQDFGHMIEKAMEILDKENIPRYKLIEPVDGFHPSLLLGHRILGDLLWGSLLKNHPDFVGRPNPNNQAIIDAFGDQGGF